MAGEGAMTGRKVGNAPARAAPANGPSESQLRTWRYEDLTEPELIAEKLKDYWCKRGLEDKGYIFYRMFLNLEHAIATLPLYPDEIDDDMKQQVRTLRDNAFKASDAKCLLHLLGER